jgi:hypothetical protein
MEKWTANHHALCLHDNKFIRLQYKASDPIILGVFGSFPETAVFCPTSPYIAHITPIVQAASHKRLKGTFYWHVFLSV